MTDTIDRNRSDDLKGLSRRGFGALSVAAGVAVAGVAEAAVEVVEENVNVKTPDGVADAALHYVKGKKGPAVLVWTDIFGLRPVFRDMGKRLAASGYTVLTPNPFYRIGHAPQPTEKPDFSTADGRAKVGALLAALTVEGSTRDAVAYIDFLDSHPATNKKAKAGTVGYCMGGPLVFRTAAARADRAIEGRLELGGQQVRAVRHVGHQVAAVAGDGGGDAQRPHRRRGHLPRRQPGHRHAGQPAPVGAQVQGRLLLRRRRQRRQEPADGQGHAPPSLRRRQGAGNGGGL